jgi:MFS family permease
LRALQHRNFQLFFSGQMISLVGTWMQTVALAWLIYRLTGSALLLGAEGFARQIPVFLIAPIGGTIADRHNRYRVVIATQTLSMVLAFILAALTLLHLIKIWEIFVLSGLLGVLNAFDIPARQAFIVEMVGKEDLMNAIALNSSMFNGARVVGPAVAGILVASIGEGWCFFANAVSFIAVIIGLLMMRIEPRQIAGATHSAVRQIAEGMKWVYHTLPVRALLTLLGLLSLLGMPYSVLMPIFADRILHGGARGLGILMGASGVGALLGAVTLTLKKSLRGLGTWIAISAAGFGIALVLFAYTRIFWLSAGLLIPVGFFIMIEMASSNTLIQSMVPDQLRGRVMSIYSMMFMGMAPIGALLSGAVAHVMGAPATVAMGGVLCLVAAVGFSLFLPSVRTTARQLIMAQGLTGGAPAEMETSGIAQAEAALDSELKA